MSGQHLEYGWPPRVLPGNEEELRVRMQWGSHSDGPREGKAKTFCPCPVQRPSCTRLWKCEPGMVRGKLFVRGSQLLAAFPQTPQLG